MSKKRASDDSGIISKKEEKTVAYLSEYLLLFVIQFNGFLMQRSYLIGQRLRLKNLYRGSS